MFNKVRFNIGLFDRTSLLNATQYISLSGIVSEEFVSTLRVLRETFVPTPSITPTLTVSRIKKVKLRILVSGFRSIQVGRPGIRKTTYLGSVESRQSVSRVNVKRIVGITSILSQEELPRIFDTIQEQFLIPQGVSSGQTINDIGSYVNRYIPGVVSSSAFGVLKANLVVITESLISVSEVSSIRPVQVVGTVGIVPENICESVTVSSRVYIVSITSSSSFGLLKLSMDAKVSSIPSVESVSNPKANIVIHLEGTLSEYESPLPLLLRNSPVFSITSSGSFGLARVVIKVFSNSINSSELLGTIKSRKKVDVQGIASSQDSLSNIYRVVKKVVPVGIVSSSVVSSSKVCKQQFVGCIGESLEGSLGNVKLSLKVVSGGIIGLSDVSNVLVGMVLKPFSVFSVCQVVSPRVCWEQFILIGNIDSFVSGTPKILSNSYPMSVVGLEDVNNVSVVYKIRPVGLSALPTIGNVKTGINIVSDSIISSEEVVSPFAFTRSDHTLIITRTSSIAFFIRRSGSFTCRTDMVRNIAIAIERYKAHDMRVAEKEYHVVVDESGSSQDIYIDIEGYMVG